MPITCQAHANSHPSAASALSVQQLTPSQTLLEDPLPIQLLANPYSVFTTQLKSYLSGKPLLSLQWGCLLHAALPTDCLGTHHIHPFICSIYPSRQFHILSSANLLQLNLRVNTKGILGSYTSSLPLRAHCLVRVADKYTKTSRAQDKCCS